MTHPGITTQPNAGVAPVVHPRLVIDLPGPHLSIAGVRMPAFRVLGLAGLLGGVLAAATLARLTGVTLFAVATVTVIGLLATAGLAAVRASRGSDDLVWSEHEAVILMVATAVGAVFNNSPALLDVVAIGLTVVLAIGRLGCLIAGCCHGRAAPPGTRLALRYGWRHSWSGFPTFLVGVPLVPVQAIEALWALLIGTCAAAMATAGAPAGAPFVIVVGLRGSGRSILDWARGDSQRVRWGPLGESQLWALATSVTVLCCTGMNLLPARWWTVAPAATVTVAIGTVVGAYRDRFSLRAPVDSVSNSGEAQVSVIKGIDP